MTSRINSKAQKKKEADVNVSSLLLGAFALFLLLLLLKNAALSMEYIRKGMTVCAYTVIPSVFPFMVLSEILLTCPVDNARHSFLDALCRKTLALPKSGLLIIVLGLLCGFPIGARCAAEAYKSGQLTKEEAERILAVSANPSPAFLLGAVGISMRGNRNFGWALFGCLGVLSLLSALLLAKRGKKTGTTGLCSAPRSVPKNSWRTVVDAIKKAAQSMLTVCAFILFFTAIAGCVELVASRFGLSQEWCALASAFLELSGGAAAARELSSPWLSVAITALAAGWSGCCVHCQILSVCEDSKLSLKTYFSVKPVQGVLCALSMLLLCKLFPALLTVAPS